MVVYTMISIVLLCAFIILVIFVTFCQNNDKNNSAPTDIEARTKVRGSTRETYDATTDGDNGGETMHGNNDNGGSTVVASVIATTALNTIAIDAGGGSYQGHGGGQNAN
uniref:Uncharacterized protein n=1 Tax=Solanum lycopersicum TaxID=4081 RepID=A0A3Q7J6A8_SOLLC